jgi:serine phosphatase RsbU (regulator of sigma subunit)
VNDVLCADMPPNMFVTCFYAVLDPPSGRLRYANAGHDLPYHRRVDGADELRATGMPLGLMPGMHYEEKETVVRAGETLLLYSDGLVEAHNPDGEMFGFGRLQRLVAAHEGGSSLVECLLGHLNEFAGPDWEQEDDVSLVVVERLDPAVSAADV